VTVTEAELAQAIAAKEAELRELKRQRRAIRSGRAGGRPKKDPKRDAQILAAYRDLDKPIPYGAIRDIAKRFQTDEGLETVERHVRRIIRLSREGGEEQ
jgi:hypothetical protein